jgi:hypothetical protein
MDQLACLPNGCIERDQLGLSQQLRQAVAPGSRADRQEGTGMLKDLFEVVIVGMLHPQEAPQFLGHGFGREPRWHLGSLQQRGVIEVQREDLWSAKLSGPLPHLR